MTGGDTRRIGGRVTEMSVTRGNAMTRAVLADSGAMPGTDAGAAARDEGSPLAGGDGAARVPLRELMEPRRMPRRIQLPGSSAASW